MGLLDFPDPINMVNEAKMGGLEREIVQQLRSAAWSNYITALWSQGAAMKWWQSEGEVLKDMAVATYLTIESLQQKGWALTVPQEMLADANRMARFQTERKTR